MIKVGSKVKYVCVMPEGTWMDEDWGETDDLEIGEVYEVIAIDLDVDPSVQVQGRQGTYDLDINCFEEVK